MDTIAKIRQKAASNLKTIALPEYEDKRVIEAVSIIEKERLANVVLLTKDKIDSALKEKYMQEYFELRKAKGIDMDFVRKLFDDPLYYAAMMTRFGEVDGYVAGAARTSADVARSAIHCLGIEKRISIASSCFIMVVPNCPYGDEGTFVYADCGVIPEPNSRQLACISLATAELARKVLNLSPRVALLSYSTKGSAEGKSINKVGEALELLKEMSPDLVVDGEFQVDTAIVPEVAKIKYPDSPVGGKANILIFPNLEAGNIGYKLTQRLANARALGPLLMGLNKPCSDLSRGCSVEDIVDCVAVTAIRAQ
ncbi:MAG: phosphate acetyltransferase [Candidatus Omnitrophica bacterium]|jgi:phosphate acetyltransferase|nr:phosphate acetyltransferase [Candidatus Omnitrophota bacterium]